MKKIGSIVGVIVVVIFILIIFIFIKGVLKSRSDAEHKLGVLQGYQAEFRDNIDKFNNTRSALKVLLGDVYTDYLRDKYDNIVLLLGREEENVENVSKIVSSMEKDCKGMIYSDASVNGFCLSYKINYEEMVNVFVMDSENINKMIDNYNQLKSASLEKFTSSKFHDYIDYNSDGKYSGKEE